MDIGKINKAHARLRCQYDSEGRVSSQSRNHKVQCNSRVRGSRLHVSETIPLFLTAEARDCS